MHPDQLDNNLNNKLISTLIKIWKKMYISISNSRYAEITRKKGNIHFNVNFMPLYDINDSRIIDKFTKGLYFNVPANKYFNKKYSNT